MKDQPNLQQSNTEEEVKQPVERDVVEIVMQSDLHTIGEVLYQTKLLYNKEYDLTLGNPNRMPTQLQLTNLQKKYECVQRLQGAYEQRIANEQPQNQEDPTEIPDNERGL